MADGCTREELKPVLDQSLTSISGERTNIHCWYASVQYEFKGTDFREKQAFAGKKPKWNARLNKTW